MFSRPWKIPSTKRIIVLTRKHTRRNVCSMKHTRKIAQLRADVGEELRYDELQKHDKRCGGRNERRKIFIAVVRRKVFFIPARRNGNKSFLFEIYVDEFTKNLLRFFFVSFACLPGATISLIFFTFAIGRKEKYFVVVPRSFAEKKNTRKKEKLPRFYHPSGNALFSLASWHAHISAFIRRWILIHCDTSEKQKNTLRREKWGTLTF